MMNRWIGKVALVTGSSGGIGLAISKALASHGIKVVGLARRINKLHEAAAEIGRDKFFPIECDVTNEEDILKVFKWIDEKFGRLDILVNNAGVLISTPIVEAVKSMKKCHIINISSVAGLYLEAIAIPIGIGPSKYGLKVLGIELRHEINVAKLNVKITNISSGAVMTDMIKVVQDVVSNNFILKVGDIAEAVIYALGTPETVEISEITVIPHGTGFIFPQRD
ncbi:farnesol dehydrogenase-like [Bombus flavifrons]|uniref:farnesol dehydrogenase-like n=1 Tax=Bombus flavifrons TaxID=103934 RepID=UPI003703DCF7